jgi:hypothetical protein
VRGFPNSETLIGWHELEVPGGHHHVDCEGATACNAAAGLERQIEVVDHPIARLATPYLDDVLGMQGQSWGSRPPEFLATGASG